MLGGLQKEKLNKWRTGVSALLRIRYNLKLLHSIKKTPNVLTTTLKYGNGNRSEGSTAVWLSRLVYGPQSPGHWLSSSAGLQSTKPALAALGRLWAAQLGASLKSVAPSTETCGSEGWLGSESPPKAPIFFWLTWVTKLRA